MAEDSSFEQLITRLHAGDQDAATQLFRRFAYRLIALARSRLDQLTLQKVDPEDVVQSAWRSFFVREANGEFELSSWDGLWGLLVVITLRKCGHCIERFRAACRDVRRERSSPAPSNDSSTSSANEAAVYCEAIAREPTPYEAAALAETMEQMMARLNERDRQMLTLCLQGYSNLEISLQVGRTERTIRRLLKQVRQWLEEGVRSEEDA